MLSVNSENNSETLIDEEIKLIMGRLKNP